MKLVFFIDNMRYLGGGEYSQFLIAKTLADRGHEVVVFAGDKHFFSKELEATPNLIVRYRRTLPVVIRKMGIGKLNAFWDKAYTSLIAKPFLKEWRPDWVIGYLRNSAVKAQRMGRSIGRPVANFIYESPPWMRDMLGNDWEEELKNRRFRKSWKMTKTAYLSSDILIPCSLLSGKKCREWLPQARISPPVYPGFIAPKVSKRNPHFDVIYIGRLNKLKNVHELIEAASMVPKCRLAIIGGGEERDALEEQAKDRGVEVKFLGSVEDDEKFKILASVRLLVFPSSFEGFGMPPLEALAVGRQALCSDIPILKEVYGKHVHYFPLHDVKAMAKKIRAILDGKIPPRPDPKPLLKKYTWENAAKTVEKILGDRR